jgi:hypothetical protein
MLLRHVAPDYATSMVIMLLDRVPWHTAGTVLIPDACTPSEMIGNSYRQFCRCRRLEPRPPARPRLRMEGQIQVL